MSPRLKSAVEGICEGALPLPMRFEMRGGGMAVLVPTIMDMNGHGNFPPAIEFELVVLDAMGDIVSRKTKKYR